MQHTVVQIRVRLILKITNELTKLMLGLDNTTYRILGHLRVSKLINQIA